MYAVNQCIEMNTSAGLTFKCNLKFTALVTIDCMYAVNHCSGLNNELPQSELTREQLWIPWAIHDLLEESTQNS